MKAMQMISPEPIENNPLRFSQLALPTLSSNEVLMRVDACAICHTDLHIIEGELPPKRSPLVPGHQIVGVVENNGRNVRTHHVGDRVGVPWLYWTCGACEFCRRGEENLCERTKFTGYDVHGGYAEYVVADERFTYPIPQGFTDEQAAPLLCAGIVGFRALRLSNIQRGGRLGLVGFGASAHIAIQVAHHWGCEVYAFSRSQHHRKLAEQLGAAWTGTTDDIPPQSLDSIISFAPTGEVVPKALKVLRKGGTLALAGIYMGPIPSFEYSLLYHERTIRSVANSTRKDAKDFLKVASEIPIKTHIEVFPLEEANRALQLLKAGKIQGAGVLRVFT